MDGNFGVVWMNSLVKLNETSCFVDDCSSMLNNFHPYLMLLPPHHCHCSCSSSSISHHAYSSLNIGIYCDSRHSFVHLIGIKIHNFTPFFFSINIYVVVFPNDSINYNWTKNSKKRGVQKLQWSMCNLLNYVLLIQFSSKTKNPSGKLWKNMENQIQKNCFNFTFFFSLSCPNLQVYLSIFFHLISVLGPRSKFCCFVIFTLTTSTFPNWSHHGNEMSKFMKIFFPASFNFSSFFCCSWKWH